MVMEEHASRRLGKAQMVLDPRSNVTLRQRKLAYESQMTLPEIDMDILLAYRPCVCGI